MKKSLFLNNLCYLVLVFFRLVQSQEDENTATDGNQMQAMFEKNFIVLPSLPKHLCSIFYNPNLTIASGKTYFSYQIRDTPEISWNYTTEKFYTVVVLGELRKEEDNSKLIKSWCQWVVVNVRENNIKEGTVLKPYSRKCDFEPNTTLKVVYAFAVFEQFKKIDLNFEEGNDNLSQILLQKYFAPLSNFIETFGGRYISACNLFFIIPKPRGVLRDNCIEKGQSTDSNHTTSQEHVNATTVDLQSIFEKYFIVPHLLPLIPEEICSVFYKPGLIIVSGQHYFPYQIQDVPEISWNYKIGKFYTVVVLGELQKDEDIPKPVKSWYQWVVVNVRTNNLKEGTVLQPFLQTDNFQPNGTHKMVHAFAVFEQLEKINLNLDEKDNSPEILLQKYFTPLSNFIKNFNGSSLLAGNFFYVIRKPSGFLRDTSPVRYLNW